MGMGKHPQSEAGFCDIRVVHFINPPRDQQKNYLDRDDLLLCLGHFDYMEVKKPTYSAKTGSVFQALKDDCDRLDDYELPMFLLRESNGMSAEEIDAFWNELSSFTALIRMHCAHDAVDSSGYLSKLQAIEQGKYEWMSRTIRSAGKGSLFVKTEHGEQKVSLLFYNPLDLSDVVAVVKSNSLLAVLRVSLYLNSLPYVHNTYTHCGISPALFQSEGEAYAPEAGRNRVFGMTRFSLADTQKVSQFLERFQSEVCDEPDGAKREEKYPRYYTTGATDILILWGEIEEKKFIGNLKKTIHIETTLYEPTESGGKYAFVDVITRIGLPHNTIENVSQGTPANTAAEIADNVRAFFEVISAENRHPILEKLDKPINTLVTMANNPIMDDFVFMVAPCVYALLTRLKQLLFDESFPVRSDEYQSDVLRFIEDWTALAQDIEGLETQVYQRFELAPVRYHIPATLLRFEQEFVFLCSRVLGELEHADGGNRTFMPMIVVDQERGINTNCPLDPRADQYTDLCPLQIHMSASMIFQPWASAVQLTHEVAHYSGDLVRNRKGRRLSMVRCAAHYVLCMWSSYSGLSTDDVSSKKYILAEKAVQSKLEQKLLLDTKGKEHLIGLTVNLSLSAQRNCSDLNLLREYEEECLSLWGMDRLIACSNQLEETALSVSNDAVIKHVRFLKELFYECYADVTMLVLLELSFDDYYAAVFEEELRYIEKRYPGGKLPLLGALPAEVKRHIDRAALVSAAMDDVLGGWMPKASKGECAEELSETIRRRKEFAQAIRRQKDNDYQDWNSDSDKVSHILYRQELDELRGYLSGCASDLTERVRFANTADAQDIRAIRDALRAVSGSGFHWEIIRSFLAQQERAINGLLTCPDSK